MSTSDKSRFERVAFSPGEFAELFGKSQTWGYRQIYAGKVKAITEHGRILIPAAEVDAILKKAGIYDGAKPKAIRTKSEIQSLGLQLASAWHSFLNARRRALPSQTLPLALSRVKKWPSDPSACQSALARLSQRSK